MQTKKKNALDDKLFCLIKFGSKKNMMKLINDGELRFSLSKEYNELVDQKERGDLYEGAKLIENAQLVKIEVEHPSLGNHTFKPVKEKLSRLTQYNYYYLSYSLYSISTQTFYKQNIHNIDKEHLNFGDSAILIKDPYKFLNSVTNQLKQEGIDYEMNFVNYLDYDREGKILISPFNKKKEHSHQMEFRIIIKNLNDAPKFIRIGAITDYSELFPSQTMIEMQWKAKRQK